MFDTLKSRLYPGNHFIKDIKNAPMREQFRGLPKLCKQNCSNCQKCLSVCPTGALSLEPFSIDMGKCTFCGACKNICKQGAIDFTNFYKLSSTQRQNLIKKSLKLRQVSAAGCNGCEMELNACSNVNFDMGRFGIDFVASPRHADGLVITGPISENMAYALEDCYKSTPDPKIVILCGTCAISGGVFQKSTKLNREFLEKHRIDLYIPGCPVHPLTFINGVLSFISGK